MKNFKIVRPEYDPIHGIQSVIFQIDVEDKSVRFDITIDVLNTSYVSDYRCPIELDRDKKLFERFVNKYITNIKYHGHGYYTLDVLLPSGKKTERFPDGWRSIVIKKSDYIEMLNSL